MTDYSPQQINFINSLPRAKRHEIYENRLKELSGNRPKTIPKYEAFKKQYFNDPVAFVHDCINWGGKNEITHYQEEIIANIPIKKRECARGPHGIGKAQPNDLLIDTPEGEKYFGDVSIGDKVFSSDGKPVTVTGVFDRGEMEVFKVVFNDGTETQCSSDHLWTVRKFDWKTNKQTTWEWITLPLSEIVLHGISRSNGIARARKWAIPTIKPLEYAYKWIPVDPYTMGAWLGDGTKNAAHISGNDLEVADRIKAAGYPVLITQQRTCKRFSISNLQFGLRHAGVFGHGAREKFVPMNYLYNCKQVREEVLRGLLDTDGTVTTQGTISFCSVSMVLANNVAWLARSLGGMARVHTNKNKNGAFYIVLLTMPDGLWFYIKRKQERIHPISQKRYLWRWIDRTEYIGKKKVRCISVDAADGLYVANDAIVTHNTAVASFLIHWFSLTRDGLDWKCPTTASAWRQLSKYLWPEVHKWSRKLRWDKVGRDPYDLRIELQTLGLKLSTGEAFAVASDDHNTIEGAHADHMLYVFDESKTIPQQTWDAAEGAFSGAGGDTVQEAFALAISTPGEPIGRFHDIQTRKAGYEDWHTRHVTLEEAIAAGRISAEWAENRRRQWGENSAIYQNRVRGEFAASDESGVVPLAWLEAAYRRWEEWDDAGRPGLGSLIVVASDIAEGGKNLTVIAPLYDVDSDICDKAITEFREFDHQGEKATATMNTCGRIVGILGDTKAKAVVDAVGVGAGVAHRLAELGKSVVAFKGGESTDRKDFTQEATFKDKNAAAWYGVRDLLNPEHGHKIAIPPNDKLTSDLTSRHYTRRSDNVIMVESKKDMKKRLKIEEVESESDSPDHGDTVAMALFEMSMQKSDSMTIPPKPDAFIRRSRL